DRPAHEREYAAGAAHQLRRMARNLDQAAEELASRAQQREMAEHSALPLLGNSRLQLHYDRHYNYAEHCRLPACAWSAYMVRRAVTAQHAMGIACRSRADRGHPQQRCI